ncbi:hypothetical protein MGSAQ_001447 [marine sediment metagenome]|uniref:Uncharacterized protein n=1 Tax=marine sediment metagenome TaxID=412755 RepID=A0A1B6NUN1_9ZZZZ
MTIQYFRKYVRLGPVFILQKRIPTFRLKHYLFPVS